MRKLFILLLYFLIAIVGVSQKIIVKVPSVVTLSEKLQLQYVINKEQATEIETPILKGLEYLSKKPGSSVANDGTTTYTFVLRANTVGPARIGSASIHIGNKILHAPAKTIKVVQQNKTDDNAMQKVDEPITSSDLQIITSVSAKKVYLQEPFVLSFLLRKKVGVLLGKFSMTTKPDFPGMVSDPVDVESSNSKIETIGKNRYRYINLLSYVVYPQKSGICTIPAVNFETSVIQQSTFKTDFEAFINGGGVLGKKVELKSRPFQIEVLPLPNPKPASYGGGVGKFDIKMGLKSKMPRTNDISSLRISISGSGNLKMLTAPHVDFPKDFDVYVPKVSVNAKKNVKGASGVVNFDYTFVPHHTGRYTIPALEWSYFDVSKNKYVVAKTEPIHLKILEGGHSIDEVNALLMNEMKELKPLHLSSDEACEEADFLFPTSFIVALLCMGVTFGLLLYILKLRIQFKNSNQYKTKEGLKKIIQQLDRIEAKHLENGDKWYYSNLSTAVRQFIAESWNIPYRDISATNLIQLLAPHSLPMDVVVRFQKFLEVCDYESFSPSGTEENKDIVKNIKELLVESVNWKHHE